MTTPTLNYLLRLAMRERDIHAKAIVNAGGDCSQCKDWGEAQAAVKELLKAGDVKQETTTEYQSFAITYDEDWYRCAELGLETETLGYMLTLIDEHCETLPVFDLATKKIIDYGSAAAQ